MKKINNFLILILAVAIVSPSCNSPTNEKEHENKREASFKIISAFGKNSKLSGMTDNGLSISADGRLFCVINETDAFLWTALQNGDDAKSRKLHGSITYPGNITVSMARGLTLANHKLYGVTENGGDNGGGTIYSIESKTQAVEIACEFTNKENLKPISLPVFDGDSSLIGLSENEKKQKLFWYVYNIYSKKITKKTECTGDWFSFGYFPNGCVQMGSDKCIYITDVFASGKPGTILRIDKNLEKTTLLYEMDAKVAGEPDGDLVFMNGKIYGLTSGGGPTDDGLIYSINMDGTGFEVLATFNGDDGHLPTCLFRSSTGMLYGTCYSGGEYNRGCFFEFNTKDKNLKILKHFKDSEGSYPNGRIVEGKDGSLFGFLRHGGKGEKGAVYRIKL
ncbi:MAG: hypothetical protein JNJ41_14925 [Bacteroidia bacterium]|nr:hypothetical protein [Bacteroidia bacterium]